MNDKMTVVFAKQTGHVLAAVSRVTAPDGKLAVADIVGTALRVRGLDNSSPIFNVPAAELDLLVLDLDSEVFYRPWLYQLDVSNKSLIRLDELVSATPPSLSATKMIVVLDKAAQATDAKVWVIIESSILSQPLILNNDVQIGTQNNETLDIPLEKTLQAGDYQGLVLASGRLPKFFTHTIP